MVKNEDDKLQAHGMTVGEMKDLQYKQIHEPDTIEMMPGNGTGDAIKDRYFKEAYENYELPVHEKGHYHVAMEARAFASGGAEPIRTSVMTVQKFTKEAFEFQKKHGGFTGMIVHLLHKPEEEKPRPRNKKVEEVVSDSTEGDKKVLEAMTVAELQEYIEEKSGEPTKLKKKADLIEAILQLKK